MDIKTLEYMEDRVKRARYRVQRIEELKRQLEKVQRIGWIHFQDQHNNNLFAISIRHDSSESNKRLINEVKDNLEKTLSNEIAQLEKELAEI